MACVAPVGVASCTKHGQDRFKVSAIIPFVYVGLGSMLGGVSRYGMTLVTRNYAVLSIPFGTLISNIVGCLLIGLIAGIAAQC